MLYCTNQRFDLRKPVDVASTNPNPYDYQNWTQDIEAYGSDNKISYGPASWSPTVTYSGALRGDGEIRFSNSGWDPAMTLSGDLSAFTGTFIAGHSSDSSNKGIFLYNTTSTGLPDADVVQQSTSKDNKLYVSGGSDKTFGSLATEVATPTNAYLLANSATTLVKTGSKSSSIYSGALCDYGSNVLSVEKVGEDTTWTLTGTNHNFSGTFTVTAGKVVFANTEAVALGSQVVVGANGTIGGSGTITSPVSFTSGGKVEVAAGAANTLTFSGDIDASTLTVKLTGELDTDTEYTILTAGSGSSGRATVEVDDSPSKGVWRTKWDGTTLKAYYVGPGFVIRIAGVPVPLDDDSGLTTWLVENSVNAASATEENFLATQNAKGISPLGAYLLGYTSYSDSTSAPTLTASISGDSFSLAYDLTGKTTSPPTIGGIALSYAIQSSSDPAFASSVTTTEGTTLAFASAGLYNKLVANIVAD